MKSFTYRAVHPQTSQIQKGQMSATDQAELTHILNQMGLELIETKTRQKAWLPLLTKRVSKQHYLIDLELLCRHMADMLQAGVPFDEAFQLCAENTSYAPFRDILQQIRQDVRAGDYVCAAFARYPTFFDPVFLALLEAGELSGHLGSTFERLYDHLTWQEKILRHIKRAVRYPLFLLTLALGVISFMFCFVLPEMIIFLEGLSQKLPWSTRLLMYCGELFMTLWWFLPFLLLSIGGIAFIMKRHSQISAQKLDQLILSLPILGNTLQKLALARMTTSLAALTQSGLPLADAFNIAKQSLGHLALQQLATQSHAQLITGYAFSDATSILFPPFALQMLKIGEKSGTMQPTLGRIAKALETDAQDSVDRFLELLEPALTLFVGAIMAWIVLAILGPIYGALAPLSQ